MDQVSSKTSFEYNFYDLNIAQTLKVDLPYALANEQITNPRFDKEHFLTQVWRSVETYCQDMGLDYDDLVNTPFIKPIIVSSSHHLYFHFLEITLMFYDPFLIKHFLHYQLNKFEGNDHAKNKDEFLGQILHIGYTTIKENSPNNNLHRKEKIFDWLEENGAKDLPERFSTMKASISDNRYKGKLRPPDITTYWMQLCTYEVKGKVVEVLSEVEVKQFLHSNFWGFKPMKPVSKLTAKNISNSELRAFSKRFFDQFNHDVQTTAFIRILKNNFSNFDSTTEESLRKNFSK